MRLWISSLLLCLMLLPAGARGQRINYIKGLPKDTVTVWKTRKLDRRQDVRYRGLNRIIPTHNILQFAGNMGLVSLGFGWDYGCRGQWETAVLLGYVPRNDGEKSYAPDRLQIVQVHLSRTDSQSEIPLLHLSGSNPTLQTIAVYLHPVFGQS